MRFNYQARSQAGVVVSDAIEAVDRSTAMREIEKMGHILISLNSATNYGFGGWLKFFWVLLVFVGPIKTLIMVVSSYMNMTGGVRGYDGSEMALLENVVYLVISIFGLYAGIMLSQMKASALRNAKIYLGLILLWSVVSIGLPSFCTFTNVTDDHIFYMTIEHLISASVTFVYVAIWATYLSFSKRVKATYLKTE